MAKSNRLNKRICRVCGSPILIGRVCDFCYDEMMKKEMKALVDIGYKKMGEYI